ncbi:MAG: toxin-activating lysine-acyltransferase [Hyphomicrobium sp.]
MSPKAAAAQTAAKSAPPAGFTPPAAPAERTPAQVRSSFMAMAETAKKARFAQLFANAIAVLMRDMRYRDLRLKDLELLLLPPVVAGQCAIAQAKAGKDGPLVPVAVALWARVSPAIDKHLAQDLDKPVTISPNEWVSGDNVWIMLLAGDPKALPGFLQELLAKDLKGKTVKMRTTGKDGTRAVKVLSAGKAAV